MAESKLILRFLNYIGKNTTSHWSRGESEIEAPLHESSTTQNFKGDLSRLPASFVFLILGLSVQLFK